MARLRAAGAVITGKTTLMELACGTPDPTAPFPVPRNPWDLGAWPGGSSSGSGSGVAAGLFLAALGTETGGSLRMPAAFCGVTGHKPTYGLVGRSGTIPLAYSMDHVGPLARSAHDAALVLDAIVGPDPGDPDSVGGARPRVADALGGTLEGVRIGVDRSDLGPGADPAVGPAFDAAVAELVASGAEVVDVTVPLHEEGKLASLVVFVAEAYAHHRSVLVESWDELSPGTRAYLGLGALLASGDYVAAQRVRRLLAQRLAAVLGEVDLVVSPTTTAGAARYDEAGYVGLATLVDHVHTMYWAGTGFPIVAVPMGATADGLPLSLQLGGRPFEDALVLRVADAYQRATRWHLGTPPLVAELEATGRTPSIPAVAAGPHVPDAPAVPADPHVPDAPAVPADPAGPGGGADAADPRGVVTATLAAAGLPAGPVDVAAIAPTAVALAGGAALLHAALAGSEVPPATGLRVDGVGPRSQPGQPR